MNWETAKTWLMVMFLVLDLVLGWQWLQSRDALRGYVESNSDMLANTKTLLAEHGLALETDVPTDSPQMATLHASFATAALTDLAKIAFPETSVTPFNPATGIITTKQGQIRLFEPGTWAVTYNPAVPFGRKQGVLSLANRLWHANWYTPDPSSNIGDETVLLERYAGYSLFDVPISLQIQKHTLLSYTENALVNITPVGANKPVISALDALDSLAVAVDKSTLSTDNKILKIDLGYLRKQPANPFGSTVTPTNYWFPVWRVVTAVQTYYINAFSGEVES